MKSKGENPVCGQMDEAGTAREGGWLHRGHGSVPVLRLLCCCVGSGGSSVADTDRTQ